MSGTKVRFECVRFNNFIDYLDGYLKEKDGRGIEISEDQKKVIESTDNTVCSANAGSGKTMVLALRYLYIIINSGESILPTNILALTFTKKAAAEMRDRIGEYISLAKSKGVISSNAYEAFSHAKITTIDSFLSDVVSAGASQGTIPIPISFSESDSLDSEEIHSDCGKEEKDSLKRISAFTGQKELDIFRKAVEYSIPFKDFEAHYALEGLLKELELFKDNPKERLLNFLNTILSEIDRICSKSNKSARQELEANVRKLRESVENGYYWGVSSKLEKYLSSSQSKILYNVIHNIEINGKKEINYIKEIAPYIQKLQCAIIYNSNPKAFEQCCDDINHIISFIRTWKLEHGRFTYTDIAYMAKYILANNKDVRNFFCRKVRKIMIDEFQDDNTLQKEILYLLSKKESNEDSVKSDAMNLEEGKLFFVGDDKQSIYRFRGADVSVFNELPKELGLTEPLSIRKNFRSSPELISFFNHVFRHESFSNPENRKVFEADFSKSMEKDEAKKDPGRIEFAYNISDDKTVNNARVEACFIADSIIEKVRTEGISFKDIMILYRSKTKKADLEKELNRHGIPYTIDGPSDLINNAIAGDFLSLFSVMSYPDDKASRIALLLSPFVQLSRASLSRLMVDSTIVESIYSDGDLLCSDLLEHEELNRLQLFHDNFRNWYSLLNRIPLTELLNVIWLSSGGYKEFLVEHSFTEYFVHFDYLLSIARAVEKQGGGISRFLSVLRNGDFDRMELDYLPDQEDSVRLMTIHKSKGLEAKIVYLYGFGNIFSKNNSEKVQLQKHVIENGNSFFLTPAISDCIFKKSDEDKELAESKRLFYVAMTRAKNELIMVSSFVLTKEDKKGRKKISDCDRRLFLKWILIAHDLMERNDKGELVIVKDFFKRLEQNIKGDGYTIELVDINNRDSEQFAIQRASCEKISNILYPRLISKGISVLDSLSILDKTRESKTGIDAIIMEAPDKFGILVHALLEHKIRGHKVEYDYKFSKDEKVNNKVFAYAEDLADGFLASDFAKLLFDGAEKKLTEQRFFIGRNVVEKIVSYNNLNADIYEGVIDLIIVKPDEVIVVDYKTDFDINPENHKNQLKVYMTVVEKLFNKKDVIGYLYYLRYGKEIRI